MAVKNNYVIFTHDLDFGSLLALTKDKGPSVIQIRTQDVLPGRIKNIIIDALQKFSSQLESGAIISIDEAMSRVRILPI